MTNRAKFKIALLLSLLLPTSAFSQVVPAVPGPTYLAVVGPATGGICTTPTGTCVNPAQGIPLDYYATSASVASQFSGVGNQLSAINGQIANMNNQILQTSRTTAAVAALKDAIPAPGDRFALRVNAASANGVVAGGFSASANLDDRTRFSVDYGGTQGRSAFSGGLNFSFN